MKEEKNTNMSFSFTNRRFRDRSWDEGKGIFGVTCSLKDYMATLNFFHQLEYINFTNKSSSKMKFDICGLQKQSLVKVTMSHCA